MAFILNALGFGYTKQAASGSAQDGVFKKIVLPSLVRDEMEPSAAMKKEVQDLLTNSTKATMNPLAKAILQGYLTSIPSLNAAALRAERSHDDNVRIFSAAS